MLGIIFTNLVEMIETRVSYEMADEILQEANLSSDGILLQWDIIHWKMW